MSDGVLSRPVGPDDHKRGPDGAPITLVEYGDYECPHCGRAHRVVKHLERTLGDKLQYVFRNFPLQQAHPRAEPAAEAAESVAVRGGDTSFWKMHDLLFEHQGALEDEDLLGYATAAGADDQGVAEDLAGGALATRVHDDFRTGVRSGVNGTPTFFVNGRRYDGDWSDPDAFAEQLLAAIGA